MIFFNEIKDRRRSVFQKIVTDDNGTVTYIREVEMPLYAFDRNGYTYFMLCDDKMVSIHDVFHFLNYRLRESPITTRRAAATALRLLYCFLSLTTYKMDNLGENEIRELIRFLQGSYSDPEKYASKTHRSPNTINSYMATYRTYFRFINVECKALFDYTYLSPGRVSDGIPEQGGIRYNSNLEMSSHKNDGVPKYISVDEFRRIYHAMDEAGDEQSKLIIHLMFGYGLRIGEVLGLTLEDICEVRENDDIMPVIYLRNRMSDARFQYCKNLPHVMDKKQYASKEYRMATQEIVLTYDMYAELGDFINANHEYMSKKYPENYATGYADIVSVKDKPDSNHYVFLSRFGRVLTDQTWNNTLRKYFDQVGIHIDADVRDNNLSHRFRHGYAMYWLRSAEHPVDILTLQKMMRHKNLASTLVYLNPTPDDEFKLKTGLQEELYDMIPELKHKGG